MADDEIDRLSSYLSSLKAQIADSQDNFNRVTITSTQKQQQQSGNYKRLHAHRNQIISTIKTEHSRRLKQIEAEQSSEIDGLHRAYEASLSKIQSNARAQVLKRTQPIDAMIQESQTTIEALQRDTDTTVQTVLGEAEDSIRDVETIHYTRQKQLEDAMKSRTSERLESLSQAKSRLAECVSTIEEMEKDHTAKMRQYQNRLQRIDTAYDEKAKRIKEKYDRTIDTLQRRIVTSNKQAEAMKKTMDKINRHHARTMNDAKSEQASLRATSTKTAKVQYEEAVETEAASSQLATVNSRIASAENTLMKIRSENESLKRELARLKHEARFSQRRAIYTQ